MADQEYFIGSVGPLYYDDTDTYPDAVTHRGFRAPQIYIEDAPASANEVLRLGDLSAAWPIGSVFLSVVATNPNTLLGFGTWSQIAQGQFLVGFKTADPDFGIVEATGGNKTVSHDNNHSGSAVADHGTTAVAAGVDTTVVNDPTHAVTQPTAHSDHNVLNPFFVLYAWKRTA